MEDPVYINWHKAPKKVIDDISIFVVENYKPQIASSFFTESLDIIEGILRSYYRQHQLYIKIVKVDGVYVWTVDWYESECDTYFEALCSSIESAFPIIFRKLKHK